MTDVTKADAKTIVADTKFLRRIFLGLVVLTALAGAMAGIATVHAMNTNLNGEAGTCQLFCN